MRGLDEHHRRAVTAITSSAQTVQPLQLHPGADKAGTLAAIADTAHHHNHRVLALPATPAAAQYAAHNRYADTTTTPRTRAPNWKTSDGNYRQAACVIVDDADHLGPEQLRWLAETAAATNTKLILISTPDSRQPAHTLLAVLTNDLPSAQHLGNPDHHHQQPSDRHRTRRTPPRRHQRNQHHTQPSHPATYTNATKSSTVSAK